MSSNTKFYTPYKPSITEVLIVLKKEFEDVEVISESEKENNRYVRVKLTFQREQRMIWVFFDSSDFDKEKPHTCFDLSVWDYSVEIMQTIGKYFGGWLIENDCSDNKPYYIENNFSIEKNNSDYLYEALTKEFDYKDIEKLCKFIQENKKLITDLNFGNE
jgi:ribosomal protein S18